MIDIAGHILDIEARAKYAGVSIEALCSRAGIARSTFDRWKAKRTTPTIGVLNQIYAALETAESQRAA